MPCGTSGGTERDGGATNGSVVSLAGFAQASGLNNRGQVVGYSASNLALLWDGGAVTELPPMAGHNVSTAAAINEQGDAAGESVSFIDTYHYTPHAVIWPHNQR